jgi:hypothetical protein
MSTEYDINYEDQRFKEVESQQSAAISENEKLYSGMIDNSDKFYKAQVDASKKWADTQSKLQQEQTDFAIEKIEQQKAQAKKDYTREQSGAYVDWQKESNKYGAVAEKIASHGMAKTGYSESSQVNLYNTYQNRVASARETFANIMMNFDNGIKDARLQNNAALAEIRFKALQQQLELNLQGFQYKNQLLLEKANQKLNIKNTYYARYQDVLKQMNTENALAEQIRQFNASLAEEQRQFDLLHSGGGGGRTYRRTKKSGGDDDKNEQQLRITKGSGGSDDVAIDTKSVMALGYGPISGSNLANKVKSGEVNVTKNGNKLVFTNNTKQSSRYIETSKYRATK